MLLFYDKRVCFSPASSVVYLEREHYPKKKSFNKNLMYFLTSSLG